MLSMETLKNFMSFFGSLILVLIFTPIVKIISYKFGFISAPRADRWKQTTTALLGGIAIYCSFIIVYLVFIPLNHFTLGLVAGASIMFLIGLWDDLRQIRPLFKLLGQFVSVIVFIAFGNWIHLFFFDPLNIALTIFWVVLLTNAFNLLDNMDGLTAGVAAVACGWISILAFINQQSMLAIIALIFFGSLLGFLGYNFNPAKIFMGDSGSMLIGLVVAILTMQLSWPSVPTNKLLLITPFLIACVPLFDTTFVSFMRILYGRKISQGGRDHTSHRLVALNFSEKKVALILYLISFFGGSINLAILFSPLPLALILIIASIIFFIILALILARVPVYSSK